MSPIFLLPDLGEGLTEAEIIEWHVAVGDEVTIDQNVVTVETAKATVEVPVPFAGTVTALHGEVGQALEVGTPLITVGSAGDAGHVSEDTLREEEVAGGKAPEAASDDEGSGAVLIGYGSGHGPKGRRARTRRGTTPAPAPASSALGADYSHVGSTPAAETAPNMGENSTQRGEEEGEPMAVRVISPVVRRLAAESRVDLQALSARLGGAVIRRADVENAIADAGAPAPSATGPVPGTPAAARPAASGPGITPTGEEVRIPLKGVRGLIAAKMVQSRTEIPDASTWVDVDATGLMAAKDALKAKVPDAGIGVLALFARIVVAGLRRFPALNASVDTATQEVVQHPAIHLGFAADSPRGLVVPVVRDAHLLSTAQLAAELRRLTKAAREGTLAPSELVGGTFTLNNYGVYGVDGSTPIINHPEAAMLGVGRIIDKPWVVGGELAVRKVTQLSLTFDHRVCDGGDSGGFIRFVADCVEDPAVMLATL